jgi:hypothetical protein
MSEPIESDLIGTQLHFTSTGRGYPVRVGSHFETRFSQRGQTITVTPGLYEASLSSRGSWLTQTDDEQVERSGRVWFARGPAPEGMTWYERDNAAEYELAKSQARTAAYAITDEVARNVALAEVRAEFSKPTSTTLVERDI